jgi:hypothetical protein
MFCFADLLGQQGSLDLAVLSHPRLPKDRQQDGRPIGCQPVRDAHCGPVERRAQFPNAFTQVTCVRLAERRSELCE